MHSVIALLLIATVFPVRSDDRIINGDDVTSTSFAPWQVSLQTSGSHFCGGSLISANFVMSACHCYQSSLTVVMGTLDIRYPGQSMFTTKMFCHPSYNSNNFDYDYSIIPLSSSANLNSAVQPIAIATKDYAAGTQALITGWGKISPGYFGERPTTLQYLYTDLVSNVQCKRFWGSQVTDRMQCAGGETDVSACQGDSGGPLAVNDEGTWYLVGNTSWGNSDCDTRYPSAWSKNSVVYSWIQSNTDI